MTTANRVQEPVSYEVDPIKAFMSNTLTLEYRGRSKCIDPELIDKLVAQMGGVYGFLRSYYDFMDAETDGEFGFECDDDVLAFFDGNRELLLTEVAESTAPIVNSTRHAVAQISLGSEDGLSENEVWDILAEPHANADGSSHNRISVARWVVCSVIVEVCRNYDEFVQRMEAVD